MSKCPINEEHIVITTNNTVFSGGSRISRREGRAPPMRALFGENVCENERIGSHRGWRAPGTPPLDPPMVSYIKLPFIFVSDVE